MNTKKKQRFVKSIGIFIGITLSLFLVFILISGDTFNWFSSISGIFTQSKTSTLKTAKKELYKNTEGQLLDFQLDETALGIPGLTMAATLRNTVKSPLSEDSIFKIEYSVSKNSFHLIEDLSLNQENVDSLNLIEMELKSSDNERTRTYYGVCKPEQLLDLGELLITYSDSLPSIMGENLDIQVHIGFSQKDPLAFQDVFLIDDDNMDPFIILFE